MLPCVIYYSEPNNHSNPNIEVYKNSLCCRAIEQILNFQKSSPHSWIKYPIYIKVPDRP